MKTSQSIAPYRFELSIEASSEEVRRRVSSSTRARDKRAKVRGLLLDYLGSGGADLDKVKVRAIYVPKAKYTQPEHS